MRQSAERRWSRDRSGGLGAGVMTGFATASCSPFSNQARLCDRLWGRVLGEGEPKYLNSPETRSSRRAASSTPCPGEAGNPRRSRAIVVEGYMDVVALAQQRHRIRRRDARNGYLGHPHPEASAADRRSRFLLRRRRGRAQAAWHALEVEPALSGGQQGRAISVLPPEHDPDSFVREEGKEAFQKRLGDSRPLSEFLLEELKSRTTLARQRAVSARA